MLYMARPKINRTPEELAEMNRERRNRYYQSHKDEESSKNLNRYHSKKVLSDGDAEFTCNCCGRYAKVMTDLCSPEGITTISHTGSMILPYTGSISSMENGYGAYDR